METHASALRVAVVQLTSTADRDHNLEVAEALVARAAQAGARLVVLPEKWPYVHGPRTVAGAESLDGPSLTAVRGWSAEHGLAVVAGSIIEGPLPGGGVHNTSVLVDAGQVVAAYRKIHMFDVEVGGLEYRESAATAPGDRVVVAEAQGHLVGLSVCYDLRFPELYRCLMEGGAQLLTVPAAFTERTGRDHWEPLLRARAIENQAAVLAAGQYGRHDDGTVSYGRSMIIDAWGTVLAQVGDGEGVAVADIDLRAQADVRRRLPALDHRRPEVYRVQPR